LEAKTQNALYTFIAQLVYNRAEEIANSSNKPSPAKIAKLIKEELGLTLSIQAIIRILKKDLSKWKDVRPAMNDDIKDIKSQLDTMKAIISDKDATPSARTRAANAYSNLMKTKLAWEKQIDDVALRQAEIERPTYELRMGAYKTIAVTCPKCRHKFYNMPAKSKDSVDSDKKEFKAGEGQATPEEATE
jgi:hypothetical protein